VVDLASNMPPAYVDWADAMLIVQGEKPRAIPYPETAAILTPQPGPEPRIHGARVFGVRPGSPVLFTIAATGQRPITFVADNLPAGLSLDASNGVTPPLTA
jgi:alpha-galactosidase